MFFSEAGMALGKYPERTVFVSIGSYRKFSDIDGRHIVRLSNQVATRQTLADRPEEPPGARSIRTTNQIGTLKEILKLPLKMLTCHPERIRRV